MTDLNEVLVFARVAQLGSFSKAARSMDMPVSTVSRRVSDLEANLGVVLMHRTTRKLSLTQAGSHLFEHCAFHLQGIEEALVALNQERGEPDGALRITVPVALGQSPFVDLVSAFVKRYPKVTVELVVTNRHVDLIADNVDLAVRFGGLKESSAIARRLGVSRRWLVAAPEYLKRKSAPKEPRDLADHRCILFHGEHREAQWDLQSERRKVSTKVSGGISGSDFNTVYEFALRGHGIALLPQAYCVHAEKTKTLTRVLPAWTSGATPVYAVYPSRRFMPVRMKVFLEQLLAWQSPHWS